MRSSSFWWSCDFLKTRLLSTVYVITRLLWPFLGVTQSHGNGGSICISFMLKTFFYSRPNKLYVYCTVVKCCFSILCSNLNFPLCTCRLFGRLFLVLSLSCATAWNDSRQTSYIIQQKDVICCSIGPLRWVVSKKKSSWSNVVHVAIWLTLGHWILSLLGIHTHTHTHTYIYIILYIYIYIYNFIYIYI